MTDERRETSAIEPTGGPVGGPAAWTADEIRRVGRRVADLIASHLADDADGPPFRPVPPALVTGVFAEPLPSGGTSVDAILDDFEAHVAPYPFGNGHARFFGWVNSPPAFVGVFAEALAAAMNPSVAGGNHAAVYVEHQVIAWFRELLGFPDAAAGLLVSGGSVASLTALAVARQRAAAAAGVDVRARGVGAMGPVAVYATTEAHGCIRKAVELLGLGSDALRLVATDAGGRMDVGALITALHADELAGVRPMAVVASAGTVNTGAIDPLEPLADLCRERAIWLHVDGAYGAPAILTARCRAELEPMGWADSVAVDPHKWLGVPVEAGLVLVRDAALMRSTFSLVPPYLQTDGNQAGVAGPPWFSEFGIQQTRGFRALKVWMALRHAGRDGYARLIERNLAQADELADRVRRADDLELVSTGLSIVCFRVAPATLGGDPERIDRLNRAVLEAVQLGGEAFLSSTVIDGRFVLRACIVNSRTGPGDIERLVDVVRVAGARLAAAGA